MYGGCTRRKHVKTNSCTVCTNCIVGILQLSKIYLWFSRITTIMCRQLRTPLGEPWSTNWGSLTKSLLRGQESRYEKPSSVSKSKEVNLCISLQGLHWAWLQQCWGWWVPSTSCLFHNGDISMKYWLTVRLICIYRLVVEVGERAEEGGCQQEEARQEQHQRAAGVRAMGAGGRPRVNRRTGKGAGGAGALETIW